MTWVESFPPVVSDQSEVLILGSMPGRESLKKSQYYAHPRNAFWRIMGALFEFDPTEPYPEKVAHLHSSRVALWDSLRACVRPGSLDSSITNEVANDFPTFFAEYPRITHIFFNGRKAETAFRRHVLPALAKDQRLLTRLPSTSPAHAAMPLEIKVQAWSIVRNTLC